jgi:hypothetical protein
MSDLMAVAGARLAGARLILVEPTWATAMPPPNKSTAKTVGNKRCIKASWTEVKSLVTSRGDTTRATLPN